MSGYSVSGSAVCAGTVYQGGGLCGINKINKWLLSKAVNYWPASKPNFWGTISLDKTCSCKSNWLSVWMLFYQSWQGGQYRNKIMSVRDKRDLLFWCLGKQQFLSEGCHHALQKQLLLFIHMFLRHFLCPPFLTEYEGFFTVYWYIFDLWRKK